jgi:hypothetical protein
LSNCTIGDFSRMAQFHDWVSECRSGEKLTHARLDHMTPWLVNHHITDHLVFVLVPTEYVMMYPATDDPISWEIHAVICSLHARNMSAVEIHNESCVVYSQNVTSEGTARQRCRMFKDGRTNDHDEEWRGQLAICSEWWSCSKCWPEKLWKTAAFHNFRTFMWIYTNFMHCSLWDDHNEARLSQVLHKIGSKNPHGCTQNAENGFRFCRLFRVIPQR